MELSELILVSAERLDGFGRRWWDVHHHVIHDLNNLVAQLVALRARVKLLVGGGDDGLPNCSKRERVALHLAMWALGIALGLALALMEAQAKSDQRARALVEASKRIDVWRNRQREARELWFAERRRADHLQLAIALLTMTAVLVDIVLRLLAKTVPLVLLGASVFGLSFYLFILGGMATALIAGVRVFVGRPKLKSLLKDCPFTSGGQPRALAA